MSDPSLNDAETPDPSEQVILRSIITHLADDTDDSAANERVVEPVRETKQAVRGCLYAVVEVGGESPERARLAERILSTLQRTYYTARGSQSAVMGEAMRQAGAVVRDFNAAQPDANLRLSLTCATLLHRRLMIACSGAGFAMLRNGGRLELFPDDPASLAPEDPETAREPEVLRWEAGPGDALLLAGPGWGDVVPVRTLAATVYYVTTSMLEDAAVGLREQARGASAPGLLIAFEAMLTPPSPQRPATPLTARRASPAGLPTSLGAAPPVTAPPVTSQVVTTAAVSGTQPASTPGPPPDPRPIEPFPAPVVQAAHQSADAPRPAPEFMDEVANGALAESSVGEAASLEPTTADRFRASAYDGLDHARNLFRQMLPERRVAGEDDFELADFGPPAGVAVAAGARISAPTVAGTEFMPAAAEVARPAPYRPPAPASGGRARLFVTLALLVALLVPVVVIAVNWERGARTRAEAQTLVTLGQQRAREAQTFLDSGDKRAALNAVSESDDYLDRAVELIGVSGPINDLRGELRTMEMEASDVQSLYALVDPLIRFPDGSSPNHVLVVDQDIYVMDPGRGVVERYRLDPSLESVPDPAAEVVLRSGEQLGTATVGPLLDMAWQPVVPGWDDKATLMVLDANNQVFRYDPRVEGPGKLDLAGSENFKTIRQLETYNGRLYLADVGTGQVKRYEAGQYQKTPSDWFDTATNMGEMLSMSIDGDIWMLMQNGQVLQFYDGQQQAFSLDNNVGLVREAVDFVVGDGTNPFIYVADRGGERIWVYDKDGKYIKQFAAPEGNPLRGLSSLYVDSVTDSMYFLTTSALYKHPLPRD